MNQSKFGFSIACIAAAALLVATPAMGQLINFPVLALAPGDADGVTTVGAGFGRGLNSNSGEQSSFAAGVSRGMERVSFGVAAGYVATDTDELTLAGDVAVHLLSDSDSPVQVSLQSGLGWMSIETAPSSSESLLNIPVGVAIQSNNDGPASVWVMPRYNFTRFAGSTESKLGASAGGSYAAENGVGFGLALDWQIVESLPDDDHSLMFGVFVFYALP